MVCVGQYFFERGFFVSVPNRRETRPDDKQMKKIIVVPGMTGWNSLIQGCPVKLVQATKNFGVGRCNDIFSYCNHKMVRRGGSGLRVEFKTGLRTS